MILPPNLSSAALDPWALTLLIASPVCFILGWVAHFLTPIETETPMPVYPEIVDSLTKLNQAVNDLPGNVQKALAAQDAAAGADKTDTIAAVSTAVDAAVAAVDAVAPAPPAGA